MKTCHFDKKKQQQFCQIYVSSNCDETLNKVKECWKNSIPLCIHDSSSLCDKVCQWLATCRWFSQGTLVSSTNKTDHHHIRDQPFNLKGGGYGILFCSEFFFRTTWELEYLFFCRAKREFFFQFSTLDYMTKTLNHIIFFFLHQNRNIFFNNIGNQNIFLEKKNIPSPPLQVKWSFPNWNSVEKGSKHPNP